MNDLPNSEFSSPTLRERADRQYTVGGPENLSARSDPIIYSCGRQIDPERLSAEQH
ncbi:hypothetical protein M0D69_14525 [Caballeronia sp. SEWSISQ10-4 2]|uniref:hypothetical protein n=1 Tax=Caballeronia sp. SEWSISQ10-4 2 TaxID=2937438 RepID=UPI00264E1385|nr:hypothetical protein [Caballeronia sp. SEWSISQ10-4 2]MDN7179201.1 hypothetical protein [Caballeronia sp. SEWSISQ10-4 2]